MGYYAEQMGASFQIKKDRQPFALAALRAMNEKKELFLDGDHITSLEDALSSCGYDVEVADEAFSWPSGSVDLGDIHHIQFNAQKYRDDEFVFAALAPYVEDGSYIEFRGEDGAMWRFQFKEGKLFVQDAVITWQDSTEFVIN